MLHISNECKNISRRHKSILWHGVVNLVSLVLTRNFYLSGHIHVFFYFLESESIVIVSMFVFRSSIPFASLVCLHSLAISWPGHFCYTSKYDFFVIPVEMTESSKKSRGQSKNSTFGRIFPLLVRIGIFGGHFFSPNFLGIIESVLSRLGNRLWFLPPESWNRHVWTSSCLIYIVHACFHVFVD